MLRQGHVQVVQQGNLNVSFIWFQNHSAKDCARKESTATKLVSHLKTNANCAQLGNILALLVSKQIVNSVIMESITTSLAVAVHAHHVHLVVSCKLSVVTKMNLITMGLMIVACVMWIHIKMSTEH